VAVWVWNSPNRNGLGLPPFGFDVALASYSEVGGEFAYNYSIVWISNISFTLSWVQFYVLTGNSSAANFAVSVHDAANSTVGVFTSNQSSWRGFSSPGNRSFPSFGGWEFGGQTAFSEAFTFHLTSSSALSGDQFEVGMELAGAPHWEEIQAITV
jgi:hypothetical protein